jgi:hypothetical protein
MKAPLLPPLMLCILCGDERPRLDMQNGICPACIELDAEETA